MGHQEGESQSIVEEIRAYARIMELFVEKVAPKLIDLLIEKQCSVNKMEKKLTLDHDSISNTKVLN